MRNHCLILSKCLLLLVLGTTAPLISGCQRAIAVEGPHIRPIGGVCLPAGTSPREIPIYTTRVDTLYTEIAIIDSASSDCDDEATVKAQLNDLQCKARLAGADALIDVRPLEHKVRGFVNNPNTPFPSSMQDDITQKFYRGTAIKYQERIRGEVQAIASRPLPKLPAGAVEAAKPSRFIPIPNAGPLGTGPASTGPQPRGTSPASNPLDAMAEPVRF